MAASRFLLSASALFLLIGSAPAQQPPGKAGGNFVPAPPGGMRIMGPGNSPKFPMFFDQGVRKELALSDEQKKKVAVLTVDPSSHTTGGQRMKAWQMGKSADGGNCAKCATIIMNRFNSW